MMRKKTVSFILALAAVYLLILFLKERPPGAQVAVQEALQPVRSQAKSFRAEGSVESINPVRQRLQEDDAASVVRTKSEFTRMLVENVLLEEQNIFKTFDGRVDDILSFSDPVGCLQEILNDRSRAGRRSAEQHDRLHMASIDALEHIASFDLVEAPLRLLASDALEQTVARPMDRHEPLAARRCHLGDKYDALAATVRLDPARGVQLFRMFSVGPQRQFLAGAVVLALVDLGVERQEARTYVASLP